jgi:hypothetical protein
MDTLATYDDLMPVDALFADPPRDYHCVVDSAGLQAEMLATLAARREHMRRSIAKLNRRKGT